MRMQTAVSISKCGTQLDESVGLNGFMGTLTMEWYLSREGLGQFLQVAATVQPPAIFPTWLVIYKTQTVPLALPDSLK